MRFIFDVVLSILLVLDLAFWVVFDLDCFGLSSSFILTYIGLVF